MTFLYFRGMRMLLFAVLLVGCGSSEVDKALLQQRVEGIRSDAALAYRIDSLQVAGEALHKWEGRPEVHKLVEGEIKTFTNQYNKPYSIKKDRFLTEEKYLQYCKANNIDPLTDPDFIR